MMLRHPPWVWMLLVVGLLLLLPAMPVSARETPYSIIQHDIKTELMVDGQATITETIRYQVRTDLRDLMFTLPYEQDQTLMISRIAVADTITKIDQAIFVETVLAEAGGSQTRAMTYDVSESGQQLEIRLHLFLKAGSTRTISLVYSVQPAVFQHTDTAYFHRQFFLRSDDNMIQKASLQLQFPANIDKELVWDLPSSLTAFTAVRHDDSRLMYTANQLAVDHVLNMTLLMPSSYFVKAPPASQRLLAEELINQAIARDTALHQQSEWRSRAYGAIFILIGLAAILFFTVYWLYDREGAIIDRQRYLRDVPHACPPVVLSLLLRRKRPAQLILSILMNLVHKEFISLDGSVFTRLAERSDQDQLSASEQFLFKWFFTDLSSSGSLTLSQVRSYAKHDETGDAFRSQYQQFLSLLDNELSDHGLLDRGKTFRGRLTACIAALIYALLAVFLTAFLQTGVALLLLVPSTGFLLYSSILRRLTNRGRERFSEGQALSRYLRRMIQLPPYPDAEKQRQLLPYAMALGLIQPYLKALPQIWDSRQTQNQFAAYGIGKNLSNPIKNQLAQLASDLHVMESMLAASLLLSERIHL
ncbi:MAG: DUF2207 domain-containing protein [Bacillota bacterium]|nr:DUF2207 domain-containing protein [Bacillota bacterium]